MAATLGYPKLAVGGPRCPSCKLAAPVGKQHHICLGGKCTTCGGQ